MSQSPGHTTRIKKGVPKPDTLNDAELKQDQMDTTVFTYSGTTKNKKVKGQKKQHPPTIDEVILLKTHLSLTNDVLYVLDRDFTIISISPGVEGAIGYKPEELLGKPFPTLGVLTPDSLDRAASDTLHVLSGGKITSAVYQFISKDGTTKFGAVSGVPLLQDGNIVGVISLARDITERKLAEQELELHRSHLEDLVKDRTTELTRSNRQLLKEIREHSRAESALRESEEKYRVLVDNANEGIFVAQDGMLRFVNPKCVEISGHSFEELTSRPFIDFIHPDDQEMVMDRHIRRMKGEDIPGVYSFRIIASDGSVKWVEINSVRIDWEGSIAALTFLSDVTARRHAEKALDERQARLDSIFRVAPAGIGLSVDHVLLEANDRICEITGYDRDELIGKSARMLYPTRQEYDSIGSKYREIRDRRTATAESRWRRKDGSIIDIILSATQLNPDDPKSGVIFTVMDITRRKQSDRALKESEAKYRFLTEKMNDMVWTADMNFRITYDSPSVEKILGFKPDERMEQDPRALMTPESFARAEGTLSKELERDKEQGVDPDRTVKLELDCYHKNGSTVWMECVVSAIRNEDGDIVGFHGVSRDISERKKTEKELDRYHETLEELVRERTLDLRKAFDQLKLENEVRKRTEESLKSREAELEEKQRNQEEMNAALKVLLRQREEDKSNIETNIITNLKSSIHPYIEKLKNSDLRENQQAYLSEIEIHLNEIASSYVKELASDYIGLSPSEIQVAILIKEGKSSKEISRLLNISLNTVLSHRYFIRMKTGLKGRKVNLMAYLQTLK